MLDRSFVIAMWTQRTRRDVSGSPAALALNAPPTASVIVVPLPVSAEVMNDACWPLAASVKAVQACACPNVPIAGYDA